MSRECSVLAEQLNRNCQCISLDRVALVRALAGGESGADLAALIDAGRPNLFADSAVFVGAACLQRMADIIAAIERVVALPAWHERVLAWAPSAARFVPKASGVFHGYDFHLSPAGPQLIEINTNAGGGLLNAALAQAQKACCEEVSAVLPGVHPAATVEQEYVDMFLEEWRTERGDVPLQRIAIVDERPAEQFLYPGIPAVPEAVRAARHCGESSATRENCASLRAPCGRAVSASTWSTIA